MELNGFVDVLSLQLEIKHMDNDVYSLVMDMTVILSETGLLIAEKIELSQLY